MSDRFLEPASDEDALRLVLAFYCIMEPEKRDEVTALAQRYASEPGAADDLSPCMRQKAPDKIRDQ
jgi:hypothetical protein